MPPRFRLRATCFFGAEFLRRLGAFAFFVRGRWEAAEDLRLCFAEFFRRFPPNPALICFADSFRLAMFPRLGFRFFFFPFFFFGAY